MNSAINTFHALMNQGTMSKGIYIYLDTNKVPMDISDLLRWQWVLSVSALDRYVHDIVRIGMLEIFEGRRNPTAKYKSFRIDLNNFNSIIESTTPVIEFEKEIIRQHSFLAFQYPEKIADALSYIWNEQNKWDVICSNMTTDISSSNLRTKLKNIITRRNQIVHEGDCFFANSPLHQQPITILDTDDVNKFITELANAIDISISLGNTK